MRAAGRIAAGLALALAGCGPADAPGAAPGGTPAASGPARNVLLIVVDTLRADRLGPWSPERRTTPHIDALAARGTLYEDCRAQGSNTRYSMLSMMSGLYVTDEEERLPADSPTLAETVRAGGRTTAAFVGNFGLAIGSRGYERGFDHFEPFVEDPAVPDAVNSKVLFGKFMSWYAANKAELAAGPGFFAWLHPMDPHLPYTAPREIRGRIPVPLPESERLRALWSDPEVLALVTPEAAADASTGAGFMLNANIAYEAEIAHVDDRLGELFAFLDEQGELDDTLVILASDHGEFVYDRRIYPEDLRVLRRSVPPERQRLKDMFIKEHGCSFHEELWNTPLIFAGPGFPAGVRRGGLAANLDLYPTVLEAFGLPLPPALAGRSLLGGALPERQHVFGYTFFIEGVLGADGFKLMDRRRKLVEVYEEGDVGAASRRGAIELYDLNSDPLEQRNLAEEQPERVAALTKLIREWKVEHHRERDTGQLTDDDLRALKELGYTQEARQHEARRPDDGN